MSRTAVDGPRLAERIERGLLAICMLVGCICLWVGVPLGWLWIGSQVQAHASLGSAMAVTLAGSGATIVLAVLLLARLNRRHMALLERRRGELPPHSLLEVLLVSSAALVMVGFGIWFVGFSGTSPIPIQLSF